jgi:hypothetical protein
MLAETVSNPAARRLGAAIAVLIVVGALFGYSVRQHSVNGDLTSQNQQLAGSLAQTQAQISALNNKVSEFAEAQRRAREEAVVAQRRATTTTVRKRRAEDSRWKQLQAKLDENGKAIDQTRQELTNTSTELRGSIAKTHDELVLLQKKGERNYFEFDLDKSKQFATAGPVRVSLRKANTKDRYADLKLVVDDAEMSQKHVNLYQPVMFYAGDSGQPIELVINSVTKNHIRGYISAPKYRATELSAMSAQPAQNGDAASAPPLRKRLPAPTH